MTRLSSLLIRVALLGAVTLAGCSNDDALPADNPFRANKSERELRLEADKLYRLARRSLENSDYTGALQRYQQILLRYPFTDYSTQAEIEGVYARYRSFDFDGAISAAERFLKQHPRHDAVDYVYYLKGLINYQRSESAFDWLVDTSKQDQTPARWAFDDFALLIQRFPQSQFAADARLRMVELRNRVAQHELHIVHYYVRRGAHIAAARRAERILVEYPGAPATHDALRLLEQSYREAGLVESADQVRRLALANGLAPLQAPTGSEVPKGALPREAPLPDALPSEG